MFALLALAGVLTAAPSPASPPANGVELIRQMHAAYAGKWYRTLTFVQKTSYPDARVETWYEAMELPGKLRIDVAPFDSMKALIFRSDSIYQYEGGKAGAPKPMIHPLMVLGFDVYGQSPEVTVAKLRQLGFDLDPVREATWQGRKHWVVGRIDPDSLSREFWVDAERLVFTRLVQAAPRGSATPGKRTLAEIQFNRYEKLGGGWVAPEVAFFHNGERVQMEEYSQMRADVALEPGIFDPGPWKLPSWIAAGR